MNCELLQMIFSNYDKKKCGFSFFQIFIYIIPNNIKMYSPVKKWNLSDLYIHFLAVESL